MRLVVLAFMRRGYLTGLPGGHPSHALIARQPFILQCLQGHGQ
jgi:hypothetical protein